LWAFWSQAVCPASLFTLEGLESDLVTGPITWSWICPKTSSSSSLSLQAYRHPLTPSPFCFCSQSSPFQKNFFSPKCLTVRPGETLLPRSLKKAGSVCWNTSFPEKLWGPQFHLWFLSSCPPGQHLWLGALCVSGAGGCESRGFPLGSGMAFVLLRI
jgi:hypothetical protein